MIQIALTLIPKDLGTHIRIKGLFDEEPSEADIVGATESLGYNPSNITFVHRKQVEEEGDEQGLWHALWTLKNLS